RNNRSGVDAVQRELANSESLVVRAELTKEREVERMFSQALKRFRRVDCLVANAGSWATEDRPLHKMSLERWRRTFDNVLTSAFLTARAFLRIVARQKRGNMVLIS